MPTQQERLLKHLNVEVGETISKDIQRVLDDEALLTTELRMWETKQEDRFKETTAIFKIDLQKPKEILEKWGTEKPEQINLRKTKQRVLAIIKDLQKNIPKKGTSTHRYGTTEGLAFQVIADDQQFIDGMRTADNPPEVSNALAHVRSALSYLTNQDVGRVGWEYQQEKRKNKFDTTVKGLGKTAIIIAALFGGILTGVPAIARMIKERKLNASSLLAPLLCFGIAIPLANPRVARMFQSVESSLKTDLNVTIRNPAFRNLCTEYQIQGQNWSRALQGMHEHPEKIKNLASHYRSRASVPQENKLQKEIDSFVVSSGLQGDEAVQLRRMIDKRQLPYLSDTLGRVQTEDGKGILLDYVKIGARKYEDQAYRTAEEMKAEAEPPTP